MKLELEMPAFYSNLIHELKAGGLVMIALDYGVRGHGLETHQVAIPSQEPKWFSPERLWFPFQQERANPRTIPSYLFSELSCQMYYVGLQQLFSL